MLGAVIKFCIINPNFNNRNKFAAILFAILWIKLKKNATIRQRKLGPTRSSESSIRT
jgi:hypothetical protein